VIEAILRGIQKGINAATPWLVGTAAGFFLLWLALLIRERKPFAKELKWFSGLAPLHKFIVVCTVCFFTLWGGSKERGILPFCLIDDISSTVTRVIRAPTYDLIQIGFSCRIQDLYDFNFEDGKLSRSAAALQIGFGNGNNSRSHGRIFRHEIRINTTYQNPFAN